MQGLAFDDAGRLWASEFGQDTFDELNLIEPGGNYGWPEVEGSGGERRLIDPQVVWPTRPGLAVAGWPSSTATCGWRALRGAAAVAHRRRRRQGRRSRPASSSGSYGRLRTVVVAPDGQLWVTTCNRDGRGDPAPDDDRILRRPEPADP